MLDTASARRNVSRDAVNPDLSAVPAFDFLRKIALCQSAGRSFPVVRLRWPCSLQRKTLQVLRRLLRR